MNVFTEGGNRASLAEWEVKAAMRALGRLTVAMGLRPPTSVTVRMLSMAAVSELAGQVLLDRIGDDKVPVALYMHGGFEDGFPTGTELAFAHDWQGLTPRRTLLRHLAHEFCHMVKALNRLDYWDEGAAEMWEKELASVLETVLDEARRELGMIGLLPCIKEEKE